ncbi:MAG: glycosyltransferase family 2 protein [Pseudomonadota bacterium]
MVDFALVTLLRDAYLADVREWVAYHLLRDVGLIVIYDHAHADGPSRNLSELLDGLQIWRDAGVVELRTQVSEDACVLSEDSDEGLTCRPDQFSVRAAYLDAALTLRTRARWVGFLDYDEFLDDGSEQPLIRSIDRLGSADTGALTVEMRRYGGSGHYLRPAGLVTASYRWREKRFALAGIRSDETRRRLDTQGNFRKSIVRPEAVVCPYFGTHSWQLRSGWRRRDASIDDFILHHYFTKSAEDFLDKFMLGTFLGHPRHHSWRTFDLLWSGDYRGSTLERPRELVEDTSMFRFQDRIADELLRSA